MYLQTSWTDSCVFPAPRRSHLSRRPPRSAGRVPWLAPTSAVTTRGRRISASSRCYIVATTGRRPWAPPAQCPPTIPSCRRHLLARMDAGPSYSERGGGIVREKHILIGEEGEADAGYVPSPYLPLWVESFGVVDLCVRGPIPRPRGNPRLYYHCRRPQCASAANVCTM